MENSSIKNNFRSVITLVDKLRDISLQSYIQLPKIVAVGSQSSGKSSLIEQVVGLDFLPRGSGVVTRRPLQIRMNFQEGLKQSYACFQQIPNTKFTDFTKVKAAIQQVTDKVCGKSTNIVDKAIVLNIYSSICPNLTIIDLPGLTRIPVGSQVENIHEVTKNMISKYMNEENAIILCVIPANQDITNDQVLYMARQIDVKGERTIGCITKIDIMDRGTDARSILMNKGQVPLKLGYVGIKNRSQQDIKENKTVKQSLQEQKMYFSKSPVYSSLPPSCMGTSSLVQKMTKVLQYCIVNYMPTLLQKIRQKKSALSQKIKQYGKALPQTPQERQGRIWQICNQFILNYKSSLRGIPSTLPSAQRIQKVSYHIQQQFKQFLLQQYKKDLRPYLSSQNIAFALKKFDTINQLGIPSLNSYLYLLNPLLTELRSPMQNSLSHLCQQINHLSQLIVQQVAREYSQFRQFLISKTSQILIQFKRKANQFMQNILESQIKGVTYQKLDLQRQTNYQNLSEIEQRFPLIPILRISIMKYYERCVINLRQLVPKNFYYFLIIQATKKIEFQIFQSCVENQQKVQKWLELKSYSVQQRLKNQKQFQVIQKAEQYILTYGGFSKSVSIKKNKKREQRQRQMEQIMGRYQEKRKLKEEKLKQGLKQQQPVHNMKKHTQVKHQVSTHPSSTKIDNEHIKHDHNQKHIDKNNTQNAHHMQRPPQVKTEPVVQPVKGPQFNFFGLKKQQKPVIAQKTAQKQSQKPKIPEAKNGVFAQLFGMGTADKKNQKKEESQKIQPNSSARKPIFPKQSQKIDNQPQTMTQKYNHEVGKATDKGIDQVFKNQKFQEESKKAVQKGASTGFQKQFNTSQQTANLFGKGAAWLWGQQKTQNIVKDQAKKQARDKTQM